MVTRPPAELERRHGCPHCALRRLLVCAGLDDDAIECVGNANTRRLGPFRAKEPIYRAGDPARSAYVVQYGVVKSERVTADGDVRVTGFYMTGEFFGVDAIGAATYSSDAVAIERSWVCEVPFDSLESLCITVPAVQHEVLRLLGEQIRSGERAGLLARNPKADTKILSFLRSLYQRMVRLWGRDVRDVRLPMRKTDIACYLGVSPEHLSRVLHDLEKAGLVRNYNRSIEFLDTETLGVAASDQMD